MIVGSNSIHNVAKIYVKVVNHIVTVVENTPPTKIIKNETILNQYSIKQRIKCFGKKARLQYKNICISFMITELLR